MLTRPIMLYSLHPLNCLYNFVSLDHFYFDDIFNTLNKSMQIINQITIVIVTIYTWLYFELLVLKYVSLLDDDGLL